MPKRCVFLNELSFEYNSHFLPVPAKSKTSFLKGEENALQDSSLLGKEDFFFLKNYTDISFCLQPKIYNLIFTHFVFIFA